MRKTRTGDQDLNLTQGEINFLMGMMIACSESNVWFDSEDEAPAVAWKWLRDNVPEARKHGNRLASIGLIDNDVNVSKSRCRLTAEAVRYLRAEHGMPNDSLRGPAVYELSCWLGANFLPKFQRLEAPPPSPGARTASKVVRQTSYTPAEAANAIAEIDRLRVEGVISPGSAIGYKATVTRRTAKE